MRISVMFDSNTYQKVLLSQKNEPNFITIYDAIVSRKIDGYFSEVIFQMEAIKKVDRPTFFDGNNANTKTTETVDADGNLHINMVISRNYSDYPQGSLYAQSQYIPTMKQLGIKIIRNNRIGMPFSIIKIYYPELYYPENFDGKNAKIFNDGHEKKSEVSLEIENMGAGLAHLKKLAPANTPLVEILENTIHTADQKAVAKAFAEWADGDAISSCIGYNIQYFCTEDVGKSAGKDSVLSAKNKAFLEKKHSTKFITVQELVNLIAEL